MQGGMTQDTGLEACEAFSGVSEEESDADFLCQEEKQDISSWTFEASAIPRGALPCGETSWLEPNCCCFWRELRGCGRLLPPGCRAHPPIGHVSSCTGCPLSSVPSLSRQGHSCSSLPPFSSPQSCDLAGTSQPCGSCLSSVLSSS